MTRRGLCILTALVVLVYGTSDARDPAASKRSRGKDEQGPNRVLILDGTTVHTVGELQMHFINWGEWGSRPNTGQPYSLQPSAQWPAGSGVEYLFSAGLWVGALRNGIPQVSTATFENEFRPTPDQRDKVYRARFGDENGARTPALEADDDEDGSIDEDPLDGYDNDGDGRIDEDFSAISSQMYTCRFNDSEPVSREIFPDHNPLNISVRQESYQWDTDRFDDFVAIEYHITNIGNDFLDEVYVGMFVDGDAGPRDRSNYWEDDLVAIRYLPLLCTDIGPVLLSNIAYTFDADGDDGRTEGLFGLMFLGHETDGSLASAPRRVGISSFQYFSGTQAFDFGGDPTNDFERYEIMANGGGQREPTSPRDYRMMVSAGPFAVLEPGATMKFQFAFLMGGSEQELIVNAASAQALFNGAWFDLDEDPTTGVEGQETPVHGPATAVWVDSCRKDLLQAPGCDDERASRGFNKSVPIVPEGQVLWTNSDCELECDFKFFCGFIEADSLRFRSGSGGRETNVNWIVNTPPPPPHARFDDHAANGVVLYWDDVSERTKDIKTQKLDFEGYQIWRADDWTRPLGTSQTTGPPTELWAAVRQMDLDNGYGEDTGLDPFLYEPLESILSQSQKRDFIDAMKEFMTEYPDDEPPCPPGVADAVCDTLKALARGELDLPGGRRYYRFVDTRVHLGRPYFYAIVAFDHGFFGQNLIEGMAGDPAGNFFYVEPKSAAQPQPTFNSEDIYVVPNPVTREALDAWRLGPTNEDPSGEKIEFRNLPKTRGTIRIFTVAGDLVQSLPFDGTSGNGTVPWDMITRNGQSITSGIYLYSIDFEGNRFDRVIKKFIVIR